jgi:hypothetical protein
LTLVLLSKLFPWRHALTIVKPDTFVRNHAKGIPACDFFVTVTASFWVLYVFVVISVGGGDVAPQGFTPKFPSNFRPI